MEGRRAVCSEACGFGKQVNLGRIDFNSNLFILPSAVDGLVDTG